MDYDDHGAQGRDHFKSISERSLLVCWACGDSMMVMPGVIIMHIYIMQMIPARCTTLCIMDQDKLTGNDMSTVVTNIIHFETVSLVEPQLVLRTSGLSKQKVDSNSFIIMSEAVTGMFFTKQTSSVKQWSKAVS